MATVVLVTHFMDEAERLCDRLAIIDRGRVVATDTPAGLIGRVEASQLLRLRTVDPLDLQQLRDLPEVDEVTTEGEQLQVRGGRGLLYAVSSLLHRTGNDAVSLRMGQATLDDAFVVLTGRPLSDAADGQIPAGDRPEVQA